MVESRPLTRRERRFSERQEEILAAAARVFAEKGFERATTRDIAQAADVSEGTLYNYFHNKDDLLVTMMTRLANSHKLERTLTDASDVDARSVLASLLKERQGYVAENYDMLKATLAEVLVHADLNKRYYREALLPILETIQAHIQARCQAGQIRPVEAALAARILMAEMIGLFVLSTFSDEVMGDREGEISDLMAFIFFEGLSV